jgi:hypothetical protein
MYNDPTKRVSNPAQWDSDDAKFRANIDAQQKAVDAARQELDSLQEQAHKAGVPEKEDSSKNNDKSQDQGKDQNKDK